MVVPSNGVWRRPWPFALALLLAAFAACGAHERKFGSDGGSGNGPDQNGAGGLDGGVSASGGAGAAGGSSSGSAGSGGIDASASGASGSTSDAGSSTPDACARNACGGCAVLTGTPGSACGQCGEYVCDPDGETVSCQDPAHVAIRALAAGGDHSCALTTSGGVRCWGKNANGQLGDGTTSDRATFPNTDVLSGAQAITAGLTHTCALMVGGGVKCWGANDFGQLGDGSLSARLTPTDVVTPSGALTGIKAVVAGYLHTCALTVQGGLRCWGLNASGQLGDGTLLNRSAAANTDLLTGVGEAAPNLGHTCALIGESPECWGFNNGGQLGDGTLNTRASPQPVLTPTGQLSGVESIATGGYHSCALMKSTRGVRCWGANGSGELGDGTTTDHLSAPDTDGLQGVQRIVAGAYHTCVLTDSSGVRCWGRNYEGQIGEGTTATRSAPPASDIITGVRELAAGQYHNCALTESSLLCWGKNVNGEVGDGTTTHRLVPTPVVFGCP